MTAAAPSGWGRFRSFWRVVLWPWALRTAHFSLFLYLFLLLQFFNIFVYLFAAAVAGSVVMFVAWKRVQVVEKQVDPTLHTGLRELYGFSLLADEDEAGGARGAEVV